jgi:hypothetical protein
MKSTMQESLHEWRGYSSGNAAPCAAPSSLMLGFEDTNTILADSILPAHASGTWN